MDARRSDLLAGLVLGRIIAGQPTEPAEPAEPAAPTGSAEPTADAEPAESTAAAGQTAAAEPTRPTDPADPAGFARPTGPAGSAEPAAASNPGPSPNPGPSRAAAPQVVRPVGPGTALVHVVIDFDTLRGAADHPAELAGYGPITAEAARAVAADAVWRRLVTDPLSGTVLDVGRTTYRPPAALAELVRARDGTCRFPGCRRAATGCELDHVVAFPDGPTSATNLAGECSRHHHVKHDTDWRVAALPDGGLEWTSPTGATYRTYPRDHRPIIDTHPPPDPPAGTQADDTPPPF